jgi:hypothetical protein
MSYKKLMIFLLMLIAIFLLAIIVFMLYKNASPILPEETKALHGAPNFSDYPVENQKAGVAQGLDFSDASHAEEYAFAFQDSLANGSNALAGSYRIVSLPCQDENASSTGDCYTLWTYDSTSGYVMKVGGNHYLPSEVHLDSRLIKAGDEYYVVNGDSVRLIYSQ